MRNMKITDWPKNPLVVKKRRFDLAAMARAFEMQDFDFELLFRDARTGTRFARQWAADAYGYGVEIDNVNNDHDLVDMRNEDNPRRISVRSFVNGKVTFQRSKFLGYKRTTRPGDLERSVRKMQAYLLVDLRLFPEVSFMEIPASAIAAAVHERIITDNGLTVYALNNFLNQNFTLIYQDVPPMPFGGNSERIRTLVPAVPGSENQNPLVTVRQMDMGF